MHYCLAQKLAYKCRGCEVEQDRRRQRAGSLTARPAPEAEPLISTADEDSYQPVGLQLTQMKLGYALETLHVHPVYPTTATAFRVLVKSHTPLVDLCSP